MTNTAIRTATALTLAVTVLSKNMKILKLWQSIVLLGFQQKNRSDVELGLNRVLRQYWYSSTYGILCTRAMIWKNCKAICTTNLLLDITVRKNLFFCFCNCKKRSFASVYVCSPTYVKSNTSKIQQSSTDAPTPPKKLISPLSPLFQNHKNMGGTRSKKQKPNASAKSVDTGVESVPLVDIVNTTNSADASNPNIVVASGSIPAVDKSETHDNANTAGDAAIRNTGDGKMNHKMAAADDAMKATAATGNRDIDGANTTGIINRTVADAVNANINQDEEGAVDALVQVSVHMRTLFYKYQISSYLTTNYSQPE
jgi:hypothetical protein